MKDARSFSSVFFAALFAASLLLGGCAGNLTGPQPEAADKPVYRIDGQTAQQADRNDGNGETTSTGASRNSADS
ncbi:MAG: hypothetical protein GVY35_01730 [Bacteroidetes bacterium]|jgi:outer membrane biogenesis lipoprotein LolB|nr:hypothetical protein [Bacteroidota bacterium]